MSDTLSYATPEARRGVDWASIWKQLGPFIGLLAVCGLFSALRFDKFCTVSNAQLILRLTAVVGTGALGMTLIIVSGGVDLSVGSLIALSTVVIALLLKAHVSQPLAIAGGIGVGVMSGFVTGNLIVGQVGRVLAVVLAVAVAAWMADSKFQANTIWICAIGVFALLVIVNELFLKRRDFNKRLGLTPFIATLGMMSALRGCAHWLGDNSTVIVRPKTIWIMSLLKQPDSQWMLLAPGVWLMIGLAIAMAFVLKFTRFGRHIFAVGSNEATARLCGVNVERTKLLIYMIGVGFAGLAGVLEFSWLKEGDSTAAPGMELNIIASVVIGGASLSGGEGSVLGSLIGALIMTTVSSGCQMMDMEPYWQEIITGGIIIVAVLIDRLRQRRPT